MSHHQYSHYCLTYLLGVGIIRVWFELYFLVRDTFSCDKFQCGINRMGWVHWDQDHFGHGSGSGDMPGYKGVSAVVGAGGIVHG